MTRVQRVAELTVELCREGPVFDVPEQAGALARALVKARPEFLAMGVLARDIQVLADARTALDAAESDVPVRFDTRPSVSDVLRLVRTTGLAQDAAVRLLGGHP